MYPWKVHSRYRNWKAQKISRNCQEVQLKLRKTALLSRKLIISFSLTNIDFNKNTTQLAWYRGTESISSGTEKITHVTVTLLHKWTPGQPPRWNSSGPHISSTLAVFILSEHSLLLIACWSCQRSISWLRLIVWICKTTHWNLHVSLSTLFTPNYYRFNYFSLL